MLCMKAVKKETYLSWLSKKLDFCCVSYTQPGANTAADKDACFMSAMACGSATST